MLPQKAMGKIFSRIKVDPSTDCWNWMGGLDQGYGRIQWQGRRYKAHRLLYLWKFNNLEEWKNKQSNEMDHLCNNRRCVNPDHLRLVTPRVNTLRGKGVGAKNANKIYCIHGHNAFYKVGDRRRCRECRRIFDASEHRKQWKKSRNWL